MIGPDTDEIPIVTQYDVERIQAQLKPGSLHSAASLWTRYVRLMEGDRRPIATRNALGRALTAAGFKRHRARRRVAGKPEEIASWFVPGTPPVDEEGDRMRLVLAEMGEGIHPEELIRETYLRLARENGWGWTAGPSEISRWLTMNGYVQMRNGGKACRYVWPGAKS